MLLHTRSFDRASACLVPALAANSHDKVGNHSRPILQMGKQAGKVKYSALGARVDLHSDQPGSKASVPKL